MEETLVQFLGQEVPLEKGCATPVQFLGQEVPLEKGCATHSRIFGLPWGLRR